MKNRRQNLPNEQVLIDFAMKNSHLTHREIAEHFNCSTSFVQSVLQRNGIQRESSKTKRNLLIRDVANANPHATLSQLAAQFNLTSEHIRQILLRFGIRRPGSSRTKKEKKGTFE